MRRTFEFFTGFLSRNALHICGQLDDPAHDSRRQPEQIGMPQSASFVRPILYRQKLLRLAEVWFDETDEGVSADVIRHIGASQPLKDASYEEFHTVLIMLQRGTEGEFLANMDKGTRYEITRAESRDDLTYSHFVPTTREQLLELALSYETHLTHRNSAVRLNVRRLSAMIKAGRLDVSSMRDRSGRTLSWHAHLMGENTARLFLSVSAFSGDSDQSLRNLCGRANRLHHWMDMRRFRALQLARYDFGGYYAGTSDNKKLQINRFKAGFGGEIVCTYDYWRPGTHLGRCALAARRVMRRSETRDG